MALSAAEELLSSPVSDSAVSRLKNGLSGVKIFGSGLLKRHAGLNKVRQRVLVLVFGCCLWRRASGSAGIAAAVVDAADLDSLKDKVSRRRRLQLRFLSGNQSKMH